MTETQDTGATRSAEHTRQPSRGTALAIGQLCIGGDWACTHGDLSTLGDIAERLVALTRAPPHGELAVLAEVCRCDSGRAVAAWYRLKELCRASEAKP